MSTIVDTISQLVNKYVPLKVSANVIWSSLKELAESRKHKIYI